MQATSSNKVLKWLSDYQTKFSIQVDRIDFSDSKEWSFSNNKSSLVHRTQGFFSITGLKFQSDFYGKSPFYQPIIYQPEIGILGFLAKHIDGELYLFAQAKTEPGNINTVQLGPTLQATESNYKALHGGKVPEYLSYFTHPEKYTILVDQLQSEQGSRFYKKRNRNMVVLIPNHIDIPDTMHHQWISIRVWKELLKLNHVVNTDSRSVIASLLFSDTPLLSNQFNNNTLAIDFQQSLNNQTNSLHDLTNILSWFTKLKTHYSLKSELIPLSELKNWTIKKDIIEQDNLPYFSINQYSIQCDSREVNNWDQPLINTYNKGFIGLITKNINGILHILLQAKIEPGNFDKIELTSTVHQSICDYELRETQFMNILNNKNNWVLAEGESSEEGGRFNKDENNYKIVLIDEDIKLPVNYAWLSLNQVRSLILFNNFFTNELRSLLALMCSTF